MVLPGVFMYHPTGEGPDDGRLSDLPARNFTAKNRIAFLSDNSFPTMASGTGNPKSVTRPPLPILLFLILAIMVPIEFSVYVGPLFMTASRTYLIILTFLILPHLGKLKLQAFDWFFIAHVAWTCTAYLIIYPLSQAVEMAGSYALEFLVVYLAARIYFTNVQQMRRTVGFLFVMLVIAGLLAIPEAYTHTRFVHNIASNLTGISYRIDYDVRLGIMRAASLFEHPILYGIFCASLFSLVWFTSTPAQRAWKAPLIIGATYFSASSAPFMILALQIAFIVIEWVSRDVKIRRDKVLAVFAASFFTFVQLFVGRGLVGIIALVALNPGTAYTRRAQWDYAIDDIMRNPWFGFIPGNYTRPFWLAASIDNWWLLMMMRAGIPSLLFIGLSALLLWIAIARRQTQDQDFILFRRGWGLMFLALVLGAATVTFFGKLQPLFAFYMGMGAALATFALPEQSDKKAATTETNPRTIRYTRFGGPLKGQQRRPLPTEPATRVPEGRATPRVRPSRKQQ
jgi:hypothetical protein